MPRKRRTGKARPELHVERFRTLLSFGFDYFSDLGDYEPSQEELKQAWRVLGPEILADFETNPKQRAGTRPYGWRIFEQAFDHRPPRDEQLTYLTEHSLRTEAERRVLA